MTDPSEVSFSKDLQTARDAAVKALADLTAAQNLVTTGPGKLQAFATQVVSNATNKVVTGLQTTDAVMSLIKAQLGGGATPPANLTKSAAPAPAVVPLRAGLPAPPLKSPALIASLNEESASAASLTKTVNDAWSGFTSCSAN